MTHIMTFSSTSINRFVGTGFNSKILDVITPTMLGTRIVGTGAITRVVASQKTRGFNFDLGRMASCVECEEIAMPLDLHSVEELDAWLMGLNLE